MEEEKNSTIIVDGKIINLNNISDSEIEEIEKRLELKANELREIIDIQIEE